MQLTLSVDLSAQISSYTTPSPSTSCSLHQQAQKNSIGKLTCHLTIRKFLEKGVLAVKDGNIEDGECKQTGEDAEIEALREKLKQHPSATNFFLNLARNEPFKGAIHCEAYLASLLLHAFPKSLMTPGDTQYYKEIKILPDLEHFGSVIGTSKRCCPTCDCFLNILRNRRDDEFLVRGRHGNISACTLPLWTPSRVVDEMNLKFGIILLQDLESLQNEVNGIQCHAFEHSKSTGLETLSLDSDGDDDWDSGPELV